MPKRCTVEPIIDSDTIAAEYAAGYTEIHCCPVCGTCIGSHAGYQWECTDDGVTLYRLCERGDE